MFGAAMLNVCGLCTNIGALPTPCTVESDLSVILRCPICGCAGKQSSLDVSLHSTCCLSYAVARPLIAVIGSGLLDVITKVLSHLSKICNGRLLSRAAAYLQSQPVVQCSHSVLETDLAIVYCSMQQC